MIEGGLPAVTKYPYIRTRVGNRREGVGTCGQWAYHLSYLEGVGIDLITWTGGDMNDFTWEGERSTMFLRRPQCAGTQRGVIR